MLMLFSCCLHFHFVSDGMRLSWLCGGVLGLADPCRETEGPSIHHSGVQETDA